MITKSVHVEDQTLTAMKSMNQLRVFIDQQNQWFDSSTHCAYLNILAAVTCMPFPTVIVRSFHHAVVYWCALSDAKTYGYWLKSCLTLFCMSILAPLERSSCTMSVWPLLPASMRGVWPFWGYKTYYNIVLQTTFESCMYRVKFQSNELPSWSEICMDNKLIHELLRSTEMNAILYQWLILVWWFIIVRRAWASSTLTY